MATTTTAEARARGAVALVLTSIVSVQCGSALATGLFDSMGPLGAVFLRTLFGAVLLLALTRGAPLRAREWPHRDVVLLGLAVAGINLFFYAALDRLPLGITVTLEFVGPLGVALLGSRRPPRPGLGAAGGGRDRPPLQRLRRRRHRRPRRGPGADRRRLLGRLHRAERPGRRGPAGGRRGDHGGRDLGAAGGAVRNRPGRRRAAHPLPSCRRRRRRPAQHRDPLRLRDGGAAAAAAGDLRRADEPRAGGRRADRVPRAVPGADRGRGRRDRLGRPRLGGRIALARRRRPATAEIPRGLRRARRRAGARAPWRSGRRPRRRGRPAPGRRRGGGCCARPRS